MKVRTKFLKIISDIHTPVGVYLKLRDLYSKVFLLESSDYKGSEISLSFICFDSKAQISVYNDIVKMTFDSKEENKKIENDKGVTYYLNNFINQFKIEKNEFEYPSNGLFGYISYELRDELFKTKSKKADSFGRNNLTFFRPRHVFLIKNKKLVIESIEDEELVSIFFEKISNYNHCNEDLPKINFLARESKKKYLKKLI